MAFETATQIGLFVFGVIAVWLAASQEPKVRMRAGIFGMLSEPFWFITSISHGQWGITCLAMVYGYSWWRVYSINRKQSENEKG